MNPSRPVLHGQLSWITKIPCFFVLFLHLVDAAGSTNGLDPYAGPTTAGENNLRRNNQNHTSRTPQTADVQRNDGNSRDQTNPLSSLQNMLRETSSAEQETSLTTPKRLRQRLLPLTEQRELQEDGALRIAAKYNGNHKLGKDVVQSCAKKVLQDSGDYILLEGDGLCLDELLRSKYLSEVDFDYQVEAIRDLVAEEDGEGHQHTVQDQGGNTPDKENGHKWRLLKGEKIYSSFNTTMMNTHGKRRIPEEMPYGIQMIQADMVGSSTNENINHEEKLIVCIADTGIAVDHPDLDPDRTTGRFTGDNRPVYQQDDLRWDRDFDGHGTHIAGTLAALGGNDQGVIGAAAAAAAAANGFDGDSFLFHIHSTRALDDEGGAFEWDTRAAITQCIDAGAKIINLSLGSERMSYSTARFYRRVIEDSGVLIIAAAGNSRSSAPIYPASHPDIISVSSVDQNGQLAQHSSYGDQIELAGPGVGIYSTSVLVDTIQAGSNIYPTDYALDTSSPRKTATGMLVHCGDGSGRYTHARNGICFMEEDSVPLQQMVDNCIQNQGIGAVILRKNPNGRQQRLSRSTPIHVMMIGKDESSTDDIYNHIGETVTIGKGNPIYTYKHLSGTSMAAAHVTAAAAIVWGQNRDCSNHQIRYVLARTATNSDTCDDEYGYGVVQVRNALDWLEENPCSDWDVPKVSTGGCSTL